MLLSNLDIWSFPLGASKGPEGKITLSLAAKNVVPINCLTVFSEQAIVNHVFQLITYRNYSVHVHFQL